MSLDPRLRMVVPKFNPARTWTAEGIVGLGGAYMCIYPMDSPGGYQLVGRTLPIWHNHPKADVFNGHPWLLEMFDRVQFHLVPENELTKLRKDFKEGKYTVKVNSLKFGRVY